MLAAKEPEGTRTATVAEALNSAETVRFLMCPPRHFAVSYSINPWMDPSAWADDGPVLTETASRQWSAFHDTLIAQGAAVEVVDPEPDLPDLVFTANAAVVLDGKVLLARFRHTERQGEEPIFNAAFTALQARADIGEVVPMPEAVCLEGAGDCLWDAARGHFWMGFGQRSHEAASRVVQETFGRECLALELADPSFTTSTRLSARCPQATSSITRMLSRNLRAT